MTWGVLPKTKMAECQPPRARERGSHKRSQGAQRIRACFPGAFLFDRCLPAVAPQHGAKEGDPSWQKIRQWTYALCPHHVPPGPDYRFFEMRATILRFEQNSFFREF